MEVSSAVSQVFDASYARLVAQLFAVCGDQATAEDAVQEAFVRAISAGSRWAQVEHPEAWLRTVALNEIRGGWRHGGVLRRIMPRIPGPSQTVELTPDHVAVVNALGRLKPDLRRVVALHYIADLSITAVAHELGIPEGTVKSRLARARELMAPGLTETEGVGHV
jgi:RNA polymerase sigma-70 factor (ECF subfamily)